MKAAPTLNAEGKLSRRGGLRKTERDRNRDLNAISGNRDEEHMTTVEERTSKGAGIRKGIGEVSQQFCAFSHGRSKERATACTCKGKHAAPRLSTAREA